MESLLILIVLCSFVVLFDYLGFADWQENGTGRLTDAEVLKELRFNRMYQNGSWIYDKKVKNQEYLP